MRRESPNGGIIWVTAAMLLGAIGVYYFRHPSRATITHVIVSSTPNADQAEDLLVKAYHANNTQPYTAITHAEVFAGGRWYRSSARITKAPDDMSLSYFNGANNGMECGYDRNWMWRKPASSPTIQPYAKLNDDVTNGRESRMQLLLHNYKVTWKGSAKIDQRPADLLEITPRHPMDDATGPAKRIWIDRATKIPLRIETFNYQMMPVMRSSLSDLELLNTNSSSSFVDDATIQAALAQTPWTVYQMGNNFDEAGRIAGVFPPLPDYLPAGFMREDVGLHRCSPQSDSCYAALSRYSDGVDTLTLFALKPSCAQKLQLDQTSQNEEQNSAAQTDEQIYVFGSGAVSTRNTKNGSIVAVGDFSPDEMRRILHSIQLKPYSMASELNGIAGATSN
ncbi:MAG: sigma-E factor regulatory protein RseB domain-containing protein [Abditibacteriaceae bacterium]